MLDEKYRTSDGVAAAHSIYIRTVRPQGTFFQNKIEKILKGSLNLIPSPSPSVRIQVMGWKVCIRCEGKTLLGAVKNLLDTNSLLTSNQQCFA